MNHHFRNFLLCLLLCLITGCGDGGGEQAVGVGTTGSSTMFGETDLAPFLRAVERHPSGVTLHLTPHSTWMNPVVGFIQESGAAERTLVHAGQSVEKARAREFVLSWGPSGETAQITLEFAPEALARLAETVDRAESLRAQSQVTQGTLDVGNGVPSISFQQASLSVTDEEDGPGTVSFQNLTLGNDQATQSWLNKIPSGSVSSGPMTAQTGTSTIAFSQAKPIGYGAQATTVSNQIQLQSLEVSFESISFPSSLTTAGSNLFTVDENYQIFYSVVGTKLRLEFILKNGREGWMGLAFHNFIFPADTVIVWWDKETDSAVVWDAYNPGIPTLPNFPSPLRDDDPILSVEGESPYYNLENVQIVSANRTDDTITIICERDLETQDIFDYQLAEGRQFYVWAGYNETITYTNNLIASQPTYTKQVTGVWKI